MEATQVEVEEKIESNVLECCEKSMAQEGKKWARASAKMEKWSTPACLRYFDKTPAIL